jgi:hypothetical protein
MLGVREAMVLSHCQSKESEGGVVDTKGGRSEVEERERLN